MTRTPLLLLALWSTSVAAQDTPAPAQDTPAPVKAPAEVDKLPPAPATMGTLTPKRLQALRTYKAQRIQVRAET